VQETTAEPESGAVAEPKPAAASEPTPVTVAPSSVVTSRVNEPEPQAEPEKESTPQSNDETYVAGPHETDVEKIKSMFTVTTNKFGHKEAVFKSPAIKGSTKLKDTLKVTPSSSNAGPSHIDADGNFTGRISYWMGHKGTDVTLPNGLQAGMGEGGSSGSSVGDGPHDVPTANEAFENTLHRAAVTIARHHSRTNQMLTNTKEDLDATRAKGEAFHENRIGKPCSFCGEKIDSKWDSVDGHRILSNGWCSNAFSALGGGGQWQNDVPEHEKGE
jgi:hypothetical protein